MQRAWDENGRPIEITPTRRVRRAWDERGREIAADEPAVPLLPPALQSQPAPPRQGYNDLAGGAASYAHGATFGAADEIAGFVGGVSEGGQSLIDPSRNAARDAAGGPSLDWYMHPQSAPWADGGRAWADRSRAAEAANRGNPDAAALERDVASVYRPGANPIDDAARGFRRVQDETTERFRDDYHTYQERSPLGRINIGPVSIEPTELAGGLLSPANAPLWRGVSAAPVVGGGGLRSAAATGVAASNAYAFNTGETWDERLDPQRHGEAAVYGALFGAGFHTLANTIAGLGRGRSPDARAMRLIQRELKEGKVPPEQITRITNQLVSQAPTEEILAETMGVPGLRMARAVANMGRGAGRPIATETLTRRAEGGRAPAPTPKEPNATRQVGTIRDRMMGEAARMTAPDQTRAPRDYWDALDSLRASRAAQGAENYRTAYAQPIDQSSAQQHLTPLMREAPDAAASGARQLDFEVRRLLGERSRLELSGGDEAALQRLDADIADARAAGVQLQAIAGGQSPNALNARAVDYFQRGLSQMERTAGMGSPEASAIGELRRGFNGLADRIAPALGDTRAQYGRSMRIENMMAEGQRVFAMSDGEIDRILRGASIEEFDAFNLGVMDAIEQKLGQGDTGFIARLMRNHNWRSQIERAVGGPAEARRFFNRLAREANMQQTHNYVLAGSRTTPLAEDIAALTDGASDFAFLSDTARQLVQSGGSLRNLGLRWAVNLYDRVHRPGIRDPAVQEALAQRLFARATRANAKELRDAIMALRSDTGLDPVVRDWIGRMIAGAAPAQPEPAQ